MLAEKYAHLFIIFKKPNEKKKNIERRNKMWSTPVYK